MVSPAPSRPPISNRLLQALTPATRQRLLPHLQPVALARGEQLGRPDDVVLHVDFVNRGFISLVKTIKDGRSVEVGGVGVEGVTDPFSLFGIEAAVLEWVVQIPGEAFRIRCDILKAEVQRDPEARRLFADYARFLLGQIAQDRRMQPAALRRGARLPVASHRGRQCTID